MSTGVALLFVTYTPTDNLAWEVTGRASRSLHLQPPACNLTIVGLVMVKAALSSAIVVRSRSLRGWHRLRVGIGKTTNVRDSFLATLNSCKPSPVLHSPLARPEHGCP